MAFCKFPYVTLCRLSKVFLRSIDGRTVPLRSETNDFRDGIGGP